MDIKFGVKRTNVPVFHVSLRPNLVGFWKNSDHISGVRDTKPGESPRPMHGRLRGGLCTLLAKALGILPTDENIADRLFRPQPVSETTSY